MLNLSTLNPQQRQAVETIHGPVLILAGAGTGKTRVITFRIAHMVERGIAPGATSSASRSPTRPPAKCRSASASLLPKTVEGRSPKSEGTATLNARPTICTFHSLCVRILRQHIEKLGYKRNFVIYDESEQLGAVKKILAQHFRQGREDRSRRRSWRC